MEQNLPKHFSKTKILGLFAVVALLLTIPLSLLMSQQSGDIRGKAAEPTQAVTSIAQGTGSIAGYVYHDADKDGERGVNEQPFSNVKIEITQIRKGTSGPEAKTNEIVSTLTTDSNGYFKFRFANLLPDSITYIVKVVLPDNYKTISTNPTILSDLHKNAREIVEFGLFPLSAQTSTTTKCTERPACLDKTPKCLLPEPTEGWCPQPSITVSPTTTSCVPRPGCLDKNPKCKLPEPAKGWCPK